MIRRPPRSTPFPTRRSSDLKEAFQKKESQKRELKDGIYFDAGTGRGIGVEVRVSDKFGNSLLEEDCNEDRKSTRLNSSHANISYAVFCLKKKISSILRSSHN